MPKIIALVEDDPILLKMYTQKFSSVGFKVITAADGEEGWMAISKAESKPSIILLDIMLPKLNGFGVLTKLKLDDRFKDIPVIMLTNLGKSKVDEAKAALLGATDYLVKSELTPGEIVEKVNKIISK